MPLKIRCPHCHKTLLADDATAGEEKLCPACEHAFTVPLPRDLKIEASTTKVGVPCPRCSADVAPGTTICPRCATVLATGRRLPWHRRLRRVSGRTWLISAAIVLVVALGTHIGVQIYRAKTVPEGAPSLAYVPPPRIPLAAASLAARLLDAKNTDERQEAHDRLLLGGAQELDRVAAAVADELQRTLAGDTHRAVSAANQRVAIELLGRAARNDPQALVLYGPVLDTCTHHDALQETAWRVRAALGDKEAFTHVRPLWRRDVRRWLFLARLAELTPEQYAAPAQYALRQTRREKDRTAEALRGLGRHDPDAVLGNLMDTYWESWSWLGQQRGARVAAELFDLARPTAPTGTGDFEAEKTAIRAARDTLLRASQWPAPTARAAAGIVLALGAPQYRSARERVADTLPASLPDIPPAAQQCVTWALARLTGRQFGGTTQHTMPQDVTRDDVVAVLHWAQTRGLVDSGELKVPADRYPQPIELTCRVVPAERQLERELLRKLREGWPAADDALDQWRAASLGCTSAVVELLNPGERAPDYPALAAALVIAAQSDQPDVRRRLTLWREATDQPAWVRELAYAALGAQDARHGTWDSGWPAKLDPAPYTQLDGPGPRWRHFGFILATGGTNMLERLNTFEPAPLPPPMMSRLTVAAERAGGGPPLVAP
ncbi:MAG: zinc ribbon domain-containing protein [Phycisphaerae bacterium]